MDSSESEDEIFFGPLTSKEKERRGRVDAAKLKNNRKTLLFTNRSLYDSDKR